MATEHHINQEDFESIEKYVSGKLSNNELIDFEKKLIAEPLLQQNVEEHKIMVNAIEKQSLKNKLDDFHRGIDKNRSDIKTLKKPSYIQKYVIAASIAILIGIGGFWYSTNLNTNQKIYATYFKPDPGLPTVMGTSNNYHFYDAMVNYKQGNYVTAIEKWEKLLITKPQNDTLNYFLGVAQLADKNQVKAILYLQKVSDKSIFIDDTHFYLGLSYLKNSELEKAKQSFEKSKNQKSLEILSILE